MLVDLVIVHLFHMSRLTHRCFWYVSTDPKGSYSWFPTAQDLASHRSTRSRVSLLEHVRLPDDRQKHY
jgi:hypothetical protein